MKPADTERVDFPALPLHAEASVRLHASAEDVFAHLDDHKRMSAHMTRRSWRMAGSRMTVDVDAAEGRAVGSVIRVSGRVLGIRLQLEEVVLERDPPLRKVWETTAPPRLLVIGPYRMGFAITPEEDSALLSVFLDYTLPGSGPERLLGRVFGGWYARWCTRRMATDAGARFG